MAISIKIEPQDFTPVYNETILVLDSTLNAEPNFQYIVDVNIDGTFSSRLKINPNLDGFAVVDLHRHIEPYINFNLDHSETSTFQRMTDSFTKYDVTLYEQYREDLAFTAVNDDGGYARYTFTPNSHLVIGDKINVTNSTDPSYNGVQTVLFVYAPGAFVVTDKSFNGTATGDAVLFDGSSITVPSSTVMSGTKWAVNSALLWKDLPSWDYSDYVLSTSSVGEFLSTLQSGTVTNLEDRFWSNVYYDSTGDAAKYLIVTTDNGVYRIENNAYLGFSDSNQFLTVGIGPWNLINTTNPVTVVSGSLPMFDSSTTSYSVYLADSSDVAISEEISFIVEDQCNRFEKFRMIYMDRFGSFLNVTFHLSSKKKINVKREKYKKNYGTYNPATNTWGYNTYDRGDKHIDSTISESYKITSGYINETMSNMVVDLIQSPEVYHLDEDGNLYAVNIKSNRTDVKTRLNDRLINYTIDFEYSFNNTVQKG